MYNQQEILNRLQQLQEQIDEIKSTILQNNTASKCRTRRKPEQLTLDDYRTFLSWNDKIVFILKYYRKPMLSSEIVTFLDNFDTVFKYKWMTIDKIKMLSTHLNRVIKKKIITRFKHAGIRGSYYSIPNAND